MHVRVNIFVKLTIVMRLISYKDMLLCYIV